MPILYRGHRTASRNSTAYVRAMKAEHLPMVEQYSTTVFQGRTRTGRTMLAFVRRDGSALVLVHAVEYWTQPRKVAFKPGTFDPTDERITVNLID